MGGIKTSAITYRRGIPNTSTNFFFVAQANYAIPSPVSKFKLNNVSTVTSPTTTPPFVTTFNFSDGTTLTSTNATLTQASYSSKTSTLVSVIIGTSCTSLGNFCFQGCSNLTSITIPTSVTSIGQGSFQTCGNLTSITIPTSVTSIGTYAFYNCSRLTSITIPSSVTSFGEGCFWLCGFTSYTIPSSIITLGNSCFQGCPNLTSVTIPSSVTSIGNVCFSDCFALNSVTFNNQNNINTPITNMLQNITRLININFYNTPGWANLNSNVKSYFLQIPPGNWSYNFISGPAP